tara:strand:+ start:905 stop:1126 length:222 start_codon:yes stop_codon:yes gene_type:complete
MFKDLFSKNLSKVDRKIRFAVSFILIPFPLLFGFKTIPISISLLGIGLFFNAVIGVCFGYKMFGISTCKVSKK